MKRNYTYLVLNLLFSLSLCSTSIAETEVKITAGDAAAGDNFGNSVSIDGDYAIVGAYLDDNVGSAYIFKRSGTNWTQQAKITANDATTNDRFGYSVALDGDFAIVGARLDDDGGNNSGSAYIFSRSGTNWIQQAKIIANDAAAEDYFGTSVSISGNYVIVGARNDDDGGTNSGSAYIFNRSGSIWTQQAKITADDADVDDWFGFSVGINGDYVIVGALRSDDGGTNSGSAYIFNRSGSIWTQQAKITASDAAANDNFGIAVSIFGDYAIAGAYLDDDGGTDTGSAYIFNRSGSNWTQQAKITADDATISDNFGQSVDIEGTRAIVGAYLDDDGETDTGSAYIFNRSGSNWTQQAKITADDAMADDQFGSSVYLSGNYAIVGALRNDDGGNNSGSAYLFSETDIELSVELSNFYCQNSSNRVQLFWETETENKGFVIRRSNSITNTFNIVASYIYDEELRGQANSAFSTNYEWIDTNVEIGNEYYYYLSDVDLYGKETHHKDKIVSVKVENQLKEISHSKKGFVLKQNYPNPFNPRTTITFDLKKDSKLKLQIFNENGEFVRELLNGFRISGSHSIVWDGKDNLGNQVSSGVYFYRLKAGESLIRNKKMILLK